MTTKQLIGFVALGLALAAGACAPADPPEKPSFAKDVLPVMEAHCVRCHGANGMLNGDAQVTNPTYRTPPNTGYFDSYDDKAGCTVQGVMGCAGAKTLAASIKIYIHTPSLRMPPKPSDPLSDWDLKLLDNWVDSGAMP